MLSSISLSTGVINSRTMSSSDDGEEDAAAIINHSGLSSRQQSSDDDDSDASDEVFSTPASTSLMRPPPWEESSPSRRKKSSSGAGGTTARTSATTSSMNYATNSPYAFNLSEDDSSTCSDLVAASQNTHPETNSLLTSESEEGTNRSNPRRVRILEVNSTTTTTGSVASVDASLTAASSSQLQMQTLSGDQPLLDPSAALNFAMEHRIFLKAALNLLTERDRHAPELGMMDPIVLKAGALKKASHLMNGVWKVKYVEIRRGMFSYYENASRKDDPQGELLLRKNIPLEAAVCTCRAVKLHQKALNFSPGGAIFELGVSASSSNTGDSSKKSSSTSTRLWMATSREERQAWIHAINNAMVGGSVTRGDSVVDHRGIVRTVSGRSPFKTDLRKYLKVQSQLRSAKTESDYLLGFRELLNQHLLIPVKWIAKQGTEKDGSDSAVPSAFAEETVARSVDQLWRDLQRDSVSIDGEVFRGDGSHGPERILGALTRSLLQSGRNSKTRSDLRESKALVYARDILLAGNRTRSGGDSYYCVSTLCQNPDLVVVVPSAAEVEPVAIDISEDDSDESFHTRFNDKSGWIKTRNKLQRTWRKQYFVLSEGTLSFYEGAIPRPHGLRGQRVLTDAILSVSKKSANQNGNPSNCDQFILTIALKDSATKDRLMLFESEDRLLDWVYALECVTRAMATSDMSAKKSNRRRSASANSNDFQNQPVGSMGDILNEAQQSTLEHALKVDMDRDYVMNRLANVSQRATSAIRVSVNACTEYNVCTTDPQGDESQDKWGVIQAHFLQAFKITGGPNGRIMRGEEIVRLSVVDCIGSDSAQANAEGGPISPTSMRARLNRRIFGGDDVEASVSAD